MPEALMHTANTSVFFQNFVEQDFPVMECNSTFTQVQIWGT